KHAKNIFPEIWEGRVIRTVEHLIKRHRDELIEVLTDGWVLVEYQLAGARQRSVQALVNLNQHPEPRRWLTERLGAISRWEVANQPSGQ
ncbi:MAG: hypothetical protein K8F25_13250, partial [Fimbriimonadaceae bacterium]|nr:hypothetical protein [Alphaproteobacteria bacterium]